MKARIFFHVTVRRFIELLFIAVLISVLLTLLNLLNFLNTQQRIITGLLLGMILYIAVNIKLMRNCFFNVESRGIHYIANYLAYILFAALNLALYSTGGNAYTWLFAITKFLVYTRFNINPFYSAIAFHAIMAAVILIAPTGMNWVIMTKDRT